MLDIILTTLPIYVTIAAGFIALKSGYLPASTVPALSQFTLKVCLLALILFAIALPHGEAGLNIPFLAAYALGSILTLGLGYLLVRIKLHKDRPESWVLAMGMSLSNSGFLGFPIANLVFGETGAVVFAMTMIVENVLIIPVATMLATLSGDKQESMGALMKAAVRQMSRNPLLITVVVALAIRFSGIPIAMPFEMALTGLAKSAAPVALFVIGGTVAGMSVSGHWGRAISVGLGKLLLHPVCVAAFLLLLPGVPMDLARVGIFFAAVPMVTIYPILAAPFGLREVCSTALIITTLASAVTMTAVLAYVH